MKKHLFLIGAAGLILFAASCSKDDNNDNNNNGNNTSTEKVDTLVGDITANRTLSKDTTYILKGFVYVKSGVTLTIPAGTVLKGDKATKGTLTVTRGGKLDAEGTAAEPIVFTSAQPAGARQPGDWGGVILLGKAPINPTGGEAKIEGGLVPTNTADEKDDIWFGGNDANDNSGTLKYVRIEFAGIAYSPDNEINGLTLGGVGAGTTISYVQVYRSGDDAFEWFGGTVNCDHLVAAYTWDDDFDTDNGFSGKVQFGVALRYKTIADQSGSNAFESDNDANGSDNSPLTGAEFSNMTIIGPVTTAGTSGINANYQNAAQIRRNSNQTIINSIFTGFPVGLYIDDTKGTATSNNIVAGTLKFQNNILAGCATPLKGTYADLQSWFDNNGNTVLDSAQKVNLVDPFKYSSALSTTAGTPNFLLAANSPAVSGADFTGFTGFQTVSYRGAFDQSNNWASGWTTWEAENTEY